jgi:hypothetical protein
VSRAYHVAVAPLATARADVQQQDHVCIEVGLLPILGEDTMRQLLLAELGRDGWTATPDGGRAWTSPDGLTATMAPDGRTITLTMTAARAVSAAARTQQEADAAVHARADAAAAVVRREATVALGRAEGDVRAAVDAALQRVYVEALQQKARSLGQIESMQRSESADGSVELTIRVRA